MGLLKRLFRRKYTEADEFDFFTCTIDTKDNTVLIEHKGEKLVSRNGRSYRKQVESKVVD